MTITVDLVEVALFVALYYALGVALVLIINAVRAITSSTSLSWDAAVRHLKDPVFYVALSVWPLFLVMEAREIISWKLQVYRTKRRLRKGT